MKNVFVLFLFALLMLGREGMAYGQDKPPTIYSSTGIVMDSSTGEILYQKNKDEQAYPASLTKLMTAILLEEHMQDGEWMTASKNATQQETSNHIFNLKVGEKMQKEEALKALLVISANDVATMIAEQIGGSEAGFAELMNDKAAAIGMKHTHFVTPNGLHNPQHYTTVYDLALLAREAMKYPAVMKAVETEQTEVATDQRKVTIKDQTSRVFQNPLALGGKTGFTNQAGNTLLEYMSKDNKTVIAVVMKSTREKEYPDVQAIGTYGLDHLDVERTFQKGDPAGETTIDGVAVQGVLGAPFVLTRPQSDSSAVFTYTPVFDPKPSETGGTENIQAGIAIGDYQIRKNGELVAHIPIVSAQAVHRPSPATAPDAAVSGAGQATAASGKSPTWPYWVGGTVAFVLAALYRRRLNRQKRRQQGEVVIPQ